MRIWKWLGLAGIVGGGLLRRARWVLDVSGGKATLDHTRGDKQLAAQLLGISARTIYRKVG